MNYRRAFVPNGYLHIIITSYDRKPIFIENIDILRTAFKNTKAIYEFEIIAICVLPNHIHLILHPNNIEQYPQIISSIKHYFSRNVGQVCPTDLPYYKLTHDLIINNSWFEKFLHHLKYQQLLIVRLFH